MTVSIVYGAPSCSFLSNHNIALVTAIFS